MAKGITIDLGGFSGIFKVCTTNSSGKRVCESHGAPKVRGRKDYAEIKPYLKKTNKSMSKEERRAIQSENYRYLKPIKKAAITERRREVEKRGLYFSNSGRVRKKPVNYEVLTKALMANTKMMDKIISGQSDFAVKACSLVNGSLKNGYDKKDGTGRVSASNLQSVCRTYGM